MTIPSHRPAQPLPLLDGTLTRLTAATGSNDDQHFGAAWPVVTRRDYMD